jgi:hypothetical protein
MTEDEKQLNLQIVEDAIHWYSEFFYSASWYMDIEYDLLEKFKTNHKYLQNFRQYQLDAMKKLYDNNLWVRWCDTCEGRNRGELYNFTGE